MSDTRGEHDDHAGALDRGALRDGVGVAALGAVPCGVIAQLLGAGDAKGTAGALLVAGVLVSLVFGAGVAAWRQRTGRPFTHALVTALATFAAVQAAGLVRRLAAGEAIHWNRIVSSAILALLAGLVGAALASFLLANGASSQRGRA